MVDVRQTGSTPEEFLSEVGRAFPGAVREPNGDSEWMIWISPDEREMFEVNWSDVHVSVNMRPLA